MQPLQAEETSLLDCIWHLELLLKLNAGSPSRRQESSSLHLILGVFKLKYSLSKPKTKELSINVDFVFHYLLLELNVSIACRYIGGGWGKQVEFLQIPAPDVNQLFWLRQLNLLPNQTVELQSFSTASIIRDNFSFRNTSYTYAKATRSGSSWSWSRASPTSRRSWRC